MHELIAEQAMIISLLLAYNVILLVAYLFDILFAVEKPKPVICGRSNSFDNVMAAPYLSGQWPKDGQWQAPKDVNSYNPQTSSSVNLGAFTHDKQTQVL